VQSSRIEAIKQAIHDYKEKFPQFLNPNYQPTRNRPRSTRNI